MKANLQSVSTRTVNLGHEQLLILEGQRNAAIKVIYGGMWLAGEQYPNAVFGGSTQDVTPRKRSETVIEMRPTRVERRAERAGLARRWRGGFDRMRGLVRL